MPPGGSEERMMRNGAYLGLIVAVAIALALAFGLF
jgi:hypothetical protein